jgi:hypothetical protein
MTIEEATSRYPNQWLGVKVIERDKESGQPIKVEVLYKDVDTIGIRAKLGVNEICTIYTGQIPDIGHLLML